MAKKTTSSRALKSAAKKATVHPFTKRQKAKPAAKKSPVRQNVVKKIVKKQSKKALTPPKKASSSAKKAPTLSKSKPQIPSKKPSPKALVTQKKAGTSKKTIPQTASKIQKKPAPSLKAPSVARDKKNLLLAPALPAKKTTRPKLMNKTSPASFSVEKATLLRNARHRNTSPHFLRNRSRRQTPVFFSLEDVQTALKNRSQDMLEHKMNTENPFHKPVTQAKPLLKKTTPVAVLPKPGSSVHQAASLTDILGFNPKETKKSPWKEYDESLVPRKFMPYFRNLLALREHVKQGLDLHAQDTLKRSSKEDSGDLSGYSQHIADAGTDTFDRDFALSLVSNEQDLLYEIDEAIQRIFQGEYGVCEITGESINRERLMAVPFTRFSLEGQREYEKTHKKVAQRSTNLFLENELEGSSTRLTDEEDDE